MSVASGARHAFVFDPNRCTGCQACRLACTIENRLEPEVSWRQVFTHNEGHRPELPLFHLSMACNHCGHPACQEACPALAYRVDEATGAVLIDEELCIGCGYCGWACPFDAPHLDEARGVMTKCTFCNDRLRQGRTPACAALCPTGALRVERLDEAALTQPLAGFPDTDLRPGIRVEPYRPGTGLAELDARPAADVVEPVEAPPLAASVHGGARPASKIKLRREWPLAVFTLLAAYLVAHLTAAGVDLGSWAPAPEPRQTPWTWLAGFSATAAIAMLLGGAHLGRKLRAWRIVLNVRRSPLSREIVLFGVFVGVGALYLARAPGSGTAGLFAVAAGIAALVAVESVYRYALPSPTGGPHSSTVLLTAPFLAGILIGAPGGSRSLAAGSGLGAVAVGIAVVTGVAKLWLYLRRQAGLAGDPRRAPGWASAMRIGIGLLAPPLAAMATGSPWPAVACALIGELVDRCLYYRELEIMTPSLSIHRAETSPPPAPGDLPASAGRSPRPASPAPGG